MKCLLMLIVSLLCFGTAWGQSNAKTDSLERVVVKEGDPVKKIKLMLAIGNHLAFTGQAEAGITKAEEALRYAQKINNQEWIGKCYYAIGEFNFTYRGKNQESLQYFEKALPYLKSTRSDDFHAVALIQIASIHSQKGHYAKAINILHEALAIGEAIKPPFTALSAIYLDLGLLYQNIKDNQEALRLYRIALAKARKVKDLGEVERAVTRIGTLYNDNHQLDSALYYLNQGLAIEKQTADRLGTGQSLAYIGSVYEKKKEYKNMLECYEQALQIFQTLDYHEGIANIYNGLGKYYFSKNSFLKSNQYAQKAIAYGRELSDLNLKLESSNLLYKTYAKLNNKDSALKYLELYLECRDSLYTTDKAKEIGKLEAQYEYEKQKEKQAVIDAEHRLRTNFTYSAVLGIILVLTGFIFYRYRAKAKLNRALQDINEELASKNEEILTQRDELAVRNEEITTQRDELAAQADQIVEQRDELDKAYHKIETAFRKLKELDEFKEAMSGMIVHDLKNPLNAIIGISNKPVMTTSDQIAIRQAGKHMLNLTLNFLDVQKFEQAQVPLHLKDEALLHIVHDAIEQVSLLIANKNLQLSISIEPTTGVFCDFDLISRVLMNIFTNAIKYTPNNGSITINAEETPDNHIQIAVSDTGQGIPADKLDTVFDKFSQVEARKSGTARSTGLGLTFCKLTVESHGGHIWVESEVGVGTTFYFTLAKALNEVKAVQPIILPAHNAVEINLTAEDQARLQPFLEKLQAFDVYEAGEILKIIAPIPDTPALSVWKTELERTIFASNQERYKELLGRF